MLWEVTTADNPPATTTRVDRRRARTRAELIEAAENLIRAGGVAELRIGDVAEAADVARASFYSHFESRDDLVEAVVSKVLGDLGDKLTQVQPGHGEIVRDMAVANRRFIRLAYDDAAFVHLLISLQEADRLFERVTHPFVERMLVEAKRTTDLPIPDVDATAAFLAGAAISTMRGILNGELGDHADLSHTELVLRLLGVPAEQAALVVAQAARVP